MRASKQVEELLTALDQQPYLIVLDGLERLLLAYDQPDAAHIDDDDAGNAAANTVASSLGLPASAVTSFTGQSRLRMTADPRVGNFLRRLAAVRASWSYRRAVFTRQICRPSQASPSRGQPHISWRGSLTTMRSTSGARSA